jgi:hypothetical protein
MVPRGVTQQIRIAHVLQVRDAIQSSSRLRRPNIEAFVMFPQCLVSRHSRSCFAVQVRMISGMLSLAQKTFEFIQRTRFINLFVALAARRFILLADCSLGLS